MKAILQDIIAHTHNLGFLNTVKVTGTSTETSIDSMSDDRKVVLFAKTHVPYSEMEGIFGMPQLNKLKLHLDCPEYKENAKIEIIKASRNGTVIPTTIHFENANGDFKNDYRFMNTEVIQEKLKSVKFKSVRWDVEVVPTLQSVQRFQFQSAANNEHTTFMTKTDGPNLKFIFGDNATHAGEFVFATGISGALRKSLTWPVAQILSILKLADVNTSKMSISDEGALQITLDSGLASYKYIIPAQA